MCRWAVGLTHGVPCRRRRTRRCPGRASWARFRRACSSESPTPATARCDLCLDCVETACTALCDIVVGSFGTAGHAGVSGSAWADVCAAHCPLLTSSGVRLQLVQSVNGGPSPTGGSPSTPSGSPSATPSPTSGGSGSSGSSGCTDRPPSQYYTCQQQARARPPPLCAVCLGKAQRLRGRSLQTWGHSWLQAAPYALCTRQRDPHSCMTGSLAAGGCIAWSRRIFERSLRRRCVLARRRNSGHARRGTWPTLVATTRRATARSPAGAATVGAATTMAATITTTTTTITTTMGGSRAARAPTGRRAPALIPSQMVRPAASSRCAACPQAHRGLTCIFSNTSPLMHCTWARTLLDTAVLQACVSCARNAASLQSAVGGRSSMCSPESSGRVFD